MVSETRIDIRRRDNARTAVRLAGILFITATAATMLSQVLMTPIVAAQNPEILAVGRRGLVATAALLEIVNALASAGIAIALYPVLRQCAGMAATGYLGLRLIEGAVGVVATVGLLLLVMTDGPGEANLALAVHDSLFLLVLIVFSTGTLVLYPLLFRFRLVPVVLSIWGLIGGLMLLASCLLILFGKTETGEALDMVLSLPIWINEMALALWLIVRGVDLHRAPLSPTKGPPYVG